MEYVLLSIFAPQTGSSSCSDLLFGAWFRILAYQIFLSSRVVVSLSYIDVRFAIHASGFLK